jgi:hypothetical protein
MKFVLVAIAVLVVAVVLAMFIRAQRNGNSTSKKPNEVYLGLRAQALNGFRKAGDAPSAVNGDEPIAVLMDMGVTNGTATVAAFNDGTASIYLSSGGGFLGGSQSHETIRKAAEHMLAVASENRPAMHETSEYPLPGTTETTFYLVTKGKVFTATAPTNDLGNQKHDLSPLFFAGQEIITQYRTIPPSGR